MTSTLLPPHSRLPVAVTTAEVTDRKGALEAFSLHKASLSSVVNILAEGGYTGQPFANGVRELLRASVQIAKLQRDINDHIDGHPELKQEPR